MINVTADLDGVVKNLRPLFEAAVNLMPAVLEDPRFLENLADEISRSKNLEGELSLWKNKTPKEIFDQLFKKHPEVSIINLTILTYYTAKNVIGYGYANTTDIYVNTKYLVNYELNDLEDLMNIGSNLLHEHGHDCGFSHDFKSTSRRPNSICYILNRAFEKTFRQIHNLPAPAPVYYTPWWKKILPWNW